MTDFITIDDYKSKLTDARLQQIIQGDEDILTECEATALAVIADHLAERYDTDSVFATTGADRPRNVMRWATNLIIYYLYERVPDKMVPERVVKNYNDTLSDLKEISGGVRSAILPRREDDGIRKTKFRWGSQPARSH